jgi:hypothetical protein
MERPLFLLLCSKISSYFAKELFHPPQPDRKVQSALEQFQRHRIQDLTVALRLGGYTIIELRFYPYCHVIVGRGGIDA